MSLKSSTFQTVLCSIENIVTDCTAIESSYHVKGLLNINPLNHEMFPLATDGVKLWPNQTDVLYSL